MSLSATNQSKKIILGVDPGSQYIGLGWVQLFEGQVHYLHHEVLKVPAKLSFFEKILWVKGALKEVILRIPFDEASIEKVFLGKNVDSAFKLGHMRGVIISLLMEAQSRVKEYAPKTIKKGVTGHGGATKESVKLLLENIFKVEIDGMIDGSDALSIAYYHALMMQNEKIYGGVQ